MKAILAVNNLGYIGLDNKIPWHNKADFKHFKSLTMGGILLVGYNTAKTLPPLPGRDVMVYDDAKPTDVFLKADWCIGGKKTYELFAQHFTELHISHIDDNTIGDIMMPDLHNLNSDCKIFNYNF